MRQTFSDVGKRRFCGGVLGRDMGGELAKAPNSLTIDKPCRNSSKLSAPSLFSSSSSKRKDNSYKSRDVEMIAEFCKGKEDFKAQSNYARY